VVVLYTVHRSWFSNPCTVYRSNTGIIYQISTRLGRTAVPCGFSMVLDKKYRNHDSAHSDIIVYLTEKSTNFRYPVHVLVYHFKSCHFSKRIMGITENFSFIGIYLVLGPLRTSCLIYIKLKKIFAFLILIPIYYTSVISGLLDILSLPHSISQNHRLFSSTDLARAQEIRSKSDSNSIFLTSYANSWFGMVLGRQVVMGFDLWIPNYGFTDHEMRKKDITDIYAGSEKSAELIQQYHVDYVVIGETEKTVYQTQ
jgi:hypothetical protein